MGVHGGENLLCSGLRAQQFNVDATSIGPFKPSLSLVRLWVYPLRLHRDYKY